MSNVPPTPPPVPVPPPPGPGAVAVPGPQPVQHAPQPQRGALGRFWDNWPKPLADRVNRFFGDRITSVGGVVRALLYFAGMTFAWAGLGIGLLPGTFAFVGMFGAHAFLRFAINLLPRRPHSVRYREVSRLNLWQRGSLMLSQRVPLRSAISLMFKAKSDTTNIWVARYGYGRTSRVGRFAELENEGEFINNFKPMAVLASLGLIASGFAPDTIGEFMGQRLAEGILYDIANLVPFTEFNISEAVDNWWFAEQATDGRNRYDNLHYIGAFGSIAFAGWRMAASKLLTGVSQGRIEALLRHRLDDNHLAHVADTVVVTSRRDLASLHFKIAKKLLAVASLGVAENHNDLGETRNSSVFALFDRTPQLTYLRAEEVAPRHFVTNVIDAHLLDDGHTVLRQQTELPDFRIPVLQQATPNLQQNLETWADGHGHPDLTTPDARNATATALTDHLENGGIAFSHDLPGRDAVVAHLEQARDVGELIGRVVQVVDDQHRRAL